MEFLPYVFLCMVAFFVGYAFAAILTDGRAQKRFSRTQQILWDLIREEKEKTLKLFIEYLNDQVQEAERFIEYSNQAADKEGQQYYRGKKMSAQAALVKFRGWI